MACKLSEYEGSRDPKVNMNWIIETNRVFKASSCRDDHNVIYASKLLEGQALISLERVLRALGDVVEENMSWEEFFQACQGKVLCSS